MKLKVLVTALALFAGTAIANAADSAWFSLENPIPAGVSVSGGGPGQTLVIDKPLGTGTTILTIGYNFTNAQQYQGVATMNGWGFSMNAAAGVTYGGEDFTNSLAAGYNNSFPAANGATLLSVATSGLGNGVGAAPVFTFELSITKPPAGPLTTNIFGELATQATSLPTAWFGSFGPNANQYGFAGYAGGPFGGNNKNLPVITINNVPEPATIALLGMGVLALIRRRR